jgi:hypothetical protein
VKRYRRRRRHHRRGEDLARGVAREALRPRAVLRAQRGEPVPADFYADMKPGLPLAVLLSGPQARASPEAREDDRPSRPSSTGRSTRTPRSSRRTSIDQRLMSKRDWEVYERALRGHPPRAAPAGRAHRADVLAGRGEEADREARSRGREGDPARLPEAPARALQRRGSRRTTSRPSCRIDTTKMDYVEDLVDLIELTRILDAALA